MNRLLLFIFLPILGISNDGISNDIEISQVTKEPLAKVVYTNAKIIQLSDQKQPIVSNLTGHIEKYFVKSGDSVKKGDKVVLIESIKLWELSANYLALTQQIKPAKAQLLNTQKLFKKGLTSKTNLNADHITLEGLLAKKSVLALQLDNLGITSHTLTDPTNKFILYAHDDGIVGKINISLHSNVDSHTSLMSLVNQESYYVIAYLFLEDVISINNKIYGYIEIGKKKYLCDFIQLFPHIDEKTQKAKVHFRIRNKPKNLLLNTFVSMEILFPSKEERLMIKKSALTLFKGEWVVFVEETDNKEEVHQEEHNNHEKEQKISYKAKVVEVIAYNGDKVAIKGLIEGEHYVSEGVYFIKSILLKSSFAGHGH